MVVNPEGLIIALLQGEVQANFLGRLKPVCLKYYEKIITGPTNANLYLNPVELTTPQSVSLNQLSFPTKLCFVSEKNMLFCSDSGNNRVLGVNVASRQIELIIGSGKRGLVNGLFENAEFDWPQGLAYDATTQRLYIADTFNNVIRVADLKANTVATVCGAPFSEASIGNYDLKGGKLGTEQTISTPWDVCLILKSDSRILLISCSGTHQIWLYSFRDDTAVDAGKLKWWNGLQIEWNTLIAIGKWSIFF